jgi:hypothetical protein
MSAITEFIRRGRDRFAVDDGNILAFSFGKVTRHLVFLEIIRQRYKEASAAFIGNSEAFRATIKPGGPYAMTQEQLRLQAEGWPLSNLVHLEIESFYLFAKILLDELAHAIENYFGPARGLSLDSHDDLAKSLRAYADVKGLTVPEEFEKAVADLRQRISDFRDQQIAHEKSPRTMRGTTWDATGEVMLATNRLYPKDGDKQVNSESLSSLASAIEGYIDHVDLIETNQSRARFKPAEGSQVSK